MSMSAYNVHTVVMYMFTCFICKILWINKIVSVLNNLLIYKTCVFLDYNKTECAQLGFLNNNETKSLETLVQPTSTRITMIYSVVETVLGSILCLFMAPWSDKFGRKPLIVLGFIVGCISMLLQVIFAAFELSPWFTMAPTLTVIFIGGAGNFITIIYAYLADITNKDERAWRIGIFDLALAAGVLIGNSCSSYLLIATNYVTVFSLGAILQGAGLLYVIFFLPESLHRKETSNAVRGFFKLSNLVEMVKTPFKKRESFKRATLLLLLLSMLVGDLTMGATSVFFYFVREKLDWTLTEYTWYGTVQSILGIIGGVFVIYFLHTYLKIKEIFLITVGLFFSIIAYILYGFATQDWEVYLGAVLNLPCSGQASLQRALISKLVHEEELAKVYSTLSIGTNVLWPVGSILYTELYIFFLGTDAGLYNFVTASLYTVVFILSLIAAFLQSKSSSDTGDKVTITKKNRISS